MENDRNSFRMQKPNLNADTLKETQASARTKNNITLDYSELARKYIMLFPVQFKNFIEDKGLNLIEDTVQEWLKFDNMFLKPISDSLNQYFEEMTHISVSLNLKSERNYRKLIDTYISTRPTENIELFTITNELLVEHTQSTYLFFERLMHPADTSSKHKINQKLVEQTISFWEIAIELSDKIEKSNQLVQDDETDEFGKKTEIFRSLQMDLLRDIEARKLLISTNRSISKIGLTEFFLQMIINVKEDGIKKGPSDSQSSASTHCDIFYVLRPYSKLNAVNRGSIEPLFSKDDQTSPFGKLVAEEDLEMKTYRRMQLFLEYDRLFNIFLSDKYYFEMIRPTQFQLSIFIMEKAFFRRKNIIEKWMAFDDIFLRAIIDQYKYLKESCETVSQYLLIFGIYQMNRLKPSNTYNQYLGDILQIYESLNLYDEMVYKRYIYKKFKNEEAADTPKEETNTDEMVKQMTELWKIAPELSEKIETSNQLIYENNDINEFGKETEVFRSLQIDILRDIEAQKLLISTNRSISKIGLTEFFLQMIINVKEDGIKKGPSDSQSSASTHCDIFYVLRPYSKLNGVNRGSIEPLFSKDDQTSPFGKLVAEKDLEMSYFFAEALRRMQLFSEYDKLFNIFLSDEYYFEMIRSTELQLSNFITEKGLINSKNIIEKWLEFDDIFLRAVSKAYNQYLEDIFENYEFLNVRNELFHRVYMQGFKNLKSDEEIVKQVVTINDTDFVKNIKSTHSFLERLMRPADTSAEETDIDEMVKQMTELWKIAPELSEKIETSNQLMYKNDDINEFGKKTEVFQSLQMEILRDIEARKFSISAKRDIPKTGLTEFFLQMIVNVKGDVVKEGTSDSQRFSFVHCDIFYVLRPHYKLNGKNAGNVEPLSYSDDETANFGFITEK
ncbi:hypothetical protein PGB90_007953 [Kerria lacca]